MIISNTLQIFSVLDERITKERLLRFKVVFFTIFTILTLPTILTLFFQAGADIFLFALSLYESCGFIIAIITVLIEQVTAVYVNILIIKNAKSLATHRQLVINISLLGLQLVLDYVAFALQVYQLMTYDGTSYANLPNNFANTYQIIFTISAIHFSTSVLAFINFKRLFVAGRSVEVESKGSMSSPVMLLDAIKEEKDSGGHKDTKGFNHFQSTVIIGAK